MARKETAQTETSESLEPAETAKRTYTTYTLPDLDTIVAATVEVDDMPGRSATSGVANPYVDMLSQSWDKRDKTLHADKQLGAVFAQDVSTDNTTAIKATQNAIVRAATELGVGTIVRPLEGPDTHWKIPAGTTRIFYRAKTRTLKPRSK